MAKDKKIRILVFLTLLFSLFVFFFRLGDRSLIEFDEGVYALVAKRMAQSSDFLTLRWQEGKAWFDKGPLYFWLTAPLLKIFGYSAFNVRFWSSFLGFLTVVSVFLIGITLADVYVGVIAASVLSATVGFVYYARLGMLDAPNAFFNTAAVWLLIKAQRNPKFLYPLSVIAAMGFLNRGFIAFLGPFAYLAYRLIFDRPFGRFGRDAVLACLLFVALTLPWHAVMFFLYRGDFLDTYFSHQMFRRFGQAIEGKGAPLFWYLDVVKTHFRVWFVLLGLFVPVIGYRLFKHDRIVWLISLWAGFTFAVFTLAQSKLIWYILPIYPPLALLVAYCLVLLLRKMGTTALFGVALLTIFVAALYDFRQRSRIYPPDFNGDLVRVVVKSNDYPGGGRLVVANLGFSVTSFYSRRVVRAVPLAELPGLLGENDLGVAFLSDLERVKGGQVFETLYQSGEVVLMAKSSSR